MQEVGPRIIFMGTPEFAVPSLRALVGAGYNVVAVVTAPDKPAGRGLALRESEVKVAARELGFGPAGAELPEGSFGLQAGSAVSRGPILQPEKLRDPAFLEQMRALQPDLGIVIAFRMLPEVVWAMPRLGTFNLHGSLLPQYRGAAPINWAIINGETCTGVTTFLLNHEIDCGAILGQVSEEIRPTDTAGMLYERLMHIGAGLVVETVDRIISGKAVAVEQENADPGVATPARHDRQDSGDQGRGNQPLRLAPKIFKEDCRIDWSWNGRRIVDFVRGLAPYPTAWMQIAREGAPELTAKIFEAEFIRGESLPPADIRDGSMPCGEIETDNRTYLQVRCADGWIRLIDLQLAGKKRMPVKELLKGWR